MAYSPELAAKPRWLVFNKIDCFTPEEAAERIEAILKALSYQGAIFCDIRINPYGYGRVV